MKKMSTKKAATYSLSRDVITTIEKLVNITSKNNRSRSMVVERLLKAGLQTEKGMKTNTSVQLIEINEAKGTANANP